MLLPHALHVQNMHTRFPFRFGIASLTCLPHLFVRLDLEIDGVACHGSTAEGRKDRHVSGVQLVVQDAQSRLRRFDALDQRIDSRCDTY